MNFLKFLPEFLKSKSQSVESGTIRREQELALVRMKMAIAKSKDYPLFRQWFFRKQMAYLDEAHTKKDWLPLYKYEALDEILNEIESAEKFVLAEEKNLENLRREKE